MAGVPIERLDSPSCATCPLNDEGTRVHGEGLEKARVVIVGEAPGTTELRLKRPFVGRSGQLLDEMLRQAGMRRSDVYITNAVLCMPLSPRTPKPHEIRCCRQRLIEEVKARSPKVIVALGKIAVKSLLNLNTSMADERGAVHRSPELNAPVLVTYHPAAVLRNVRLYRDLLGDMKKIPDLLGGVSYAANQPIRYFMVRERADLIRLVQNTAHLTDMAYDVETDSAGRLLCLGVSLNEYEAHVIVEDALEQTNLLSMWMNSKRLIGHNTKFDRQALWRHGVRGDLKTGGDTMLMSYLLDPFVGQHGLKHLVREHLSFYEDYSAFVGSAEKKRMEDVPKEALYRYNAYDAALTFLLYRKLNAQIQADAGYTAALNHLMYPGFDALADMEYLGIQVDVPYLNTLNAQLLEERAQLKEQMKEMVNKEFNPNSTPQLVQVLYKDLELPIPTRLSTDKKALDLLERFTHHPFLKMLRDYRSKSKFHSTYVKGLLAAKDAVDRVHTTFNMHVTATGRLSSSHPVNLQNIPRESEARNIFIASPGYTLIEGDLVQAEVRGWALLSGDENLRKAILSGMDMHSFTASLMFGVPAESVTKDQRTKAKRVTFGVLYGMTAETLASDLNISLNEAAQLQKNLFAKYSQGHAWIKEIQTRLREELEYRTIFGRKLRFIVTPDNVSEAMRQMVNYPIQNLASDITLSALVRIHKKIKAGLLGDTRLLLTVHDSILAETREDTDEVARIIQSEMEAPVANGRIPFAADIKIGTAWGKMQKRE